MLCATGLLQAAADQSLFRFLCYYPLVFPIPNFLFLHICEHPIYKRNTSVFPSTEGKKISCTNLSLFYYISTRKSSVFPLCVLAFMCKYATPPIFLGKFDRLDKVQLNFVFFGINSLYFVPLLKFTYLLYWNFNSIFFTIKPCVSCRALHFQITALMCVINLHVFFRILSSLLK